MRRYRLRPEDVRRDLNRFEARYGLPSERLVDAFRIDGRLVETPDFHRWSKLYALWRRLDADDTE